MTDEQNIITCWECGSIFPPDDAEVIWIASCFEGEDAQAYECPECEVAQYGIEVVSDGGRTK